MNSSVWHKSNTFLLWCLLHDAVEGGCDILVCGLNVEVFMQIKVAVVGHSH